MGVLYTLPFAGQNKVTSAYGYRTLNGAGAFHKGLDIVGVTDRQVRAVISGTVKSSTIITDKADLTWQWGNYIKVLGDDGNFWFYCHLASRAVAVGQRVEQGDVLGVMGNTGYSLGAHTHLEVRDANGDSFDPCELLGIADMAGVTYDSAALEAACIGWLDCLADRYRWRTGPGTDYALYKPAAAGGCLYCRKGVMYRVYEVKTVNGVLWCRIAPSAACLTAGSTPALWVSAECGGHLAKAPKPAMPAVDWQSACNEFTVSATGADRGELRALCERLCLPVTNGKSA